MNRLIAAWAPAMVLLAAVMSQPPAPVFRSFDRVQLLEEASETLAGVNIGDLNGDGLFDIVLGKGRHGRVLLNDPRVASSPAIYRHPIAGIRPRSRIWTARASWISSSAKTIPIASSFTTMMGRGLSQSSARSAIRNGAREYVTLADLNGDSFPDIIAANRGDGRVAAPSFVCLNDRKGHFPASEALPTESATSIVAANLDGDGKGRFPTATKAGAEKAWRRGRPETATITPISSSSKSGLGGAFVRFNRVRPAI